MANESEHDIKDEKNPRPLDEDDIALLKTYVCVLYFFCLIINPKLCMGLMFYITPPLLFSPPSVGWICNDFLFSVI